MDAFEYFLCLLPVFRQMIKRRFPPLRHCLFGADSAVKGGANRELAATILRPRAGVVKLVNTADLKKIEHREAKAPE